MPTYQYACTNADCANRFELVQSFSDPAASECPVCGGAVRKVFSSVGVVFKGSGFYRTDSRAAASASAGSSSGSASNGSSNGSASNGSDAGSSSAATPSTAPASTGSGPSTSSPAAAAS